MTLSLPISSLTCTSVESRIALLSNRVAIVTGVSRRIGIGAAIARRLLDDGARVLATGWPAHDAEMPWGEDRNGQSALFTVQDFETSQLAYETINLEDPTGPDALLDATVEHFGRVDIVVANHARSSHQSFFEVAAEDVARLVAWLVSDDARWITGQVINSEGGFRRMCVVDRNE